MKKLLVLFLLVISVNCMAQIETGLLIGGGIGNVTNTSLRLNDPGVIQTLEKSGKYSLNYQFNTTLGYRFRLYNPKHKAFFYDLDVLTGIKKIELKTSFSDETNALSEVKSSDWFCPVSLAASVNYRIMKGLYVGVGVAPTCIFASKIAFDIPVVAKVGYDIKNKIGFSLSYQHSLLKAFKTNEYDGGRFSEWNVSVYIPFTLNKLK